MEKYTILLILFILSHSLQPLSSQDEGNNSQPICPSSFRCSSLGYLSFPFYSSNYSACGLCEVDCDQQVAKIKLKQDYPSYDLEQVMPGSSDSILVQDNNFAHQISNNSCASLIMYSFPTSSSSIYYSISPTLRVLRCEKGLGLDGQIDQFFDAIGEYYGFDSCVDYNYYYTYSDGYISSANANLPPRCSVVVLPGNSPSMFSKETDYNNLFNLLTSELTIVVQVSESCQDCHKKGGQCLNENQGFWCKYSSSSNIKKENARNIVIKSALVTIAVGTVIVSILLFICARFKILSRHNSENYSNLEAIIKNHEALAPKRYSYSHVKKMTNCFKVKVGEGGYGCVYRGKLQNGNEVAVKVLNALKGNGEDLVNELLSISKTCHVNIVSLLGFCFEGRHRALIYEYMPNGSLEKFIYNPSSVTSGNKLEWKKLYEIAVGIGRGLEYLHRGCNTRILHFDIKPHNILLDQDFCPKISDFGLAKLCPEKTSVISMSGMRGTPGYIAPEVFSRNFGGVSHKSDVYSYGMMVLEMVGGRRNVVVEDDDGTSSNMCFFDSVYKQVVSNKNKHLVSDEQANKMMLVSLWCIQSDPSSRPSMSKVLDMLEGDVMSIPVPPKPFLFSTTRSHH